nr:hypothetical protein [Angustibacter aerolatus]
MMANAVSPTSGTLAALLGGGAGYLLRGVLPTGDRGDAVVLVAAAAVYLAAALLARRMPVGLLGPDAGEPGAGARVGWHAIAEGARHVRERRPALHALAAVGVSRFAYGISTIASILLCRNTFSDPADTAAGLRTLALVFGATAVGFGLAALVTPPASDRWGPSGWIWRCFVLAAAVQAVFVVRLTLPVALGGAVLLGLAVQGSKICVDAIVQREVDDGYRGRVFAFYDVVFNVAFVAAAAAAALVVPPGGSSTALLAVIGVLYAGAALAYGARGRRPGLTAAAAAGGRSRPAGRAPSPPPRG